jgi:two-component system nitrate/nitrite response regulator NarL
MKKIMLVDDVDISNYIMKKLISKVSSEVDIYEFTLPEIAFSEIKSINPDLIFLDLNMPVMNGWEFLDRMNETNTANKVYILTSSPNETDINRSKKYTNVEAFLIKPMNITVLDNLLNEAVTVAELTG